MSEEPPSMAAPVRFRILGPLEVGRGVLDQAPTAPRVRQVLGLLLIRHGRVVRTSEFLEEIWGDQPPSSAVSTLQTYIHKLRRLFPAGDEDGNEGIVLTRQNGYQCRVPRGQLDLCELETIVPQGLQALQRGDCDQADRLLCRALSLWRGPTLADVPAGRILTVQIAALEETRLRVAELALEADLRRGRYHTAINELQSLVRAHPLHEGFHAKLILALHRCGRKREAFDVFRNLRNALADELGLDPSEELQRLLEEISPTVVSVEPADQHAAMSAVQPPAQLPPDIADFSGRERVLAQIEQHLIAAEHGTGTRIAWLTGMPGVGKTAVALRVAHRLRHRFPDGQLFADLTCTSRRTPADVLLGFLRALGLPGDQIPEGVDERGKLFRTHTVDRRILVVLDDAYSAQQVEPLLPGPGHSAVLVTSRWHGLAGAAVFRIDVMKLTEGIELLTNIVGGPGALPEIETTRRVVQLCGGLPLALRAVAARAAATGGRTLSLLADRLSDPGTRLSTLRFDGLDVAARYDLSRNRLSAQEWAAFRLLGMLPLGSFTVGRAAEALGCDRDVASQLLTRLAENHLLQVQRGQPQLHYAFHEVTHAYARHRMPA